MSSRSLPYFKNLLHVSRHLDDAPRIAATLTSGFDRPTIGNNLSPRCVRGGRLSNWVGRAIVRGRLLEQSAFDRRDRGVRPGVDPQLVHRGGEVRFGRTPLKGATAEASMLFPGARCRVTHSLY